MFDFITSIFWLRNSEAHRINRQKIKIRRTVKTIKINWKLKCDEHMRASWSQLAIAIELLRETICERDDI